MVIANPPQTPAQRDRLLKIQRDAMIWCCDLDHPQGQAAVAQLRALCPDVEQALQLGHKVADLRYCLVLAPHAEPRMAVAMVAPDRLREGLQAMVERSRMFGAVFAAVIVPQNPTIAALFGEFMGDAGTG